MYIKKWSLSRVPRRLRAEFWPFSKVPAERASKPHSFCAGGEPMEEVTSLAASLHSTSPGEGLLPPDTRHSQPQSTQLSIFLKLMAQEMCRVSTRQSPDTNRLPSSPVAPVCCQAAGAREAAAGPPTLFSPRHLEGQPPITESGTFAIPFIYPTPDKPHVPCHKLFSFWCLHRDGSVGYATRQTRHSCGIFADLSGVVGWSTRHSLRNGSLVLDGGYTSGREKCRVSGSWGGVKVP
jgi:hypothetical protein